MKYVICYLLILIFSLPKYSYSANYYVSNSGSDVNSGSTTAPWRTIEKATKSIVAGDTVYVRGGQYEGISNGWRFQNSGTQSKPITFSNFPGEQVILKILTADRNDREIFRCIINPRNPPSWSTPKADYIHIIGIDVTTRKLSNGVDSKKGIVVQGMVAEQSSGIIAGDCDSWEVSGIDFVDVSNGIFTFKDNWSTMTEHSTDHWYVHDNRVHTYYRESGMQFNGNHNRIENNEIYKVTDRVDTPYGCQLINLLGNNNVVRGNKLSQLGSKTNCTGILFEWDISDNNVIEKNKIFGTSKGIDIEGGDNNIIRNNIIYSTDTPSKFVGGIEIKSYDNNVKKDWPCDETEGSSQAIVPPNNPAHPDYKYYYNPRNCHSYGNQIYNNTIHGFVEGIRLYPLVGSGTIIRNNVFSMWSRGSICLYNSSNGTCRGLPTSLIADHNASQGNFSFVDVNAHNFGLKSNSPLINSGYNLGSLVSDDFDGVPRPQSGNYDIGAYENKGSSTLPSTKPTLITEGCSLPKIKGDTNCDGKINLVDFSRWKAEYLGQVTTKISDFNNDGQVNLVDFSVWKTEYLK
ncbi:right-handed parallel beta-helix repeat-containing protein [Candidatus Shapirobacteria bacterium]|nr:right-handed parallel beta-helix repeat-containing protein [Candidatus Shapirobacteria bacterium]